MDRRSGLLFIAFAASFDSLSGAAEILPIGTADTAWTGIAAAETMLVLAVPINLGRIVRGNVP